MLDALDVPHAVRVVSAHRTPKLLAEFAEAAEADGLEVIVAGAGGAAHLPGMLAAHTVVPVLGVPVQSKALQGMDSLLSIVQMPGGRAGRHHGHRPRPGPPTPGCWRRPSSPARGPSCASGCGPGASVQTADVLAHPDPRGA